MPDIEKIEAERALLVAYVDHLRATLQTERRIA